MTITSWTRVAIGMQLVAQATADLVAREVGTVATRAAQHGTDVMTGSSSRVVSSSSAVLSSVASHLEEFHHLLLLRSQQTQTQQQRHDGNINDEPAAAIRNQRERSDDDEGEQQQQRLNQQHWSTFSPPPRSASSSSTSSSSSSPFRSSSINTKDSRRDTPEDEENMDSTAATTMEDDALTGADSSTSIRLPSEDTSARKHQEEDWYSHTTLKEGSAVPSTRFGRAMGFASLGAGLALGTAWEGVSRVLGGGSSSSSSSSSSDSGSSSSSSSSSSSLIATASNSDRLAASLCRMRGAALKMGQMLSIQDESLLPPELTRALHKVRQGAEAMPQRQLHHQLTQQLGVGWRDRFVEFEERPFAAASIGQVHRASIRKNDDSDSNDNTDYDNQIIPVVVKVQYPGVANSIASDLRNLSMLVSWTGLAPKGLFLDNVIRVGEAELQVECDYKRELANQKRMKHLVESDPFLQENKFTVPRVFAEWSTDQVLTSAYCKGGTIDKVIHLDQEERNRIGRAIMYLTIQELFTWRTMQTDPQWANYLYDIGSGTTSLIDFGATRDYSKEFVDGYLRMVWASANRDEDMLMEQSYRMKFLTGDENTEMIRAHQLSGFTVGEPFFRHEAFDFRGSNISTRMGEHTSVFLRHRLTPPPEEVYTLHRKLAGAYMLCIKLGAVVPCRDLLEQVVANHQFEDGLGDIIM